MTRPTDGTDPTDLIAGNVLDDLTPEEAARLRQIIEEDPGCAEAAQSFEAAFSLLPYGSPTVEPSTRLKEKILSAASRSSTVSASPNLTVISSNEIEPAIARPRRWRRWMPAISTGIAAVAVAALGFNHIELTRLRNELQASQKTAALLSNLDTQVQSLVGTVPSSTNQQSPTARLLAQPGDRQVTLVTQDLPKLSEEQIYRLWSIADTSAPPLYCGQFRQDDSGTAQWNVPDAACTKQPLQVIITLDAPNDPITSAGPLVMQSLS